jgi:hypothetical protein
LSDKISQGAICRYAFRQEDPVSLIRIIHGLTLKIRLQAVAPVFSAIVVAISTATHAADTNVAIAANFTEPAKEIAQVFESKIGHRAILSFGANGAVLYTNYRGRSLSGVFVCRSEHTEEAG